MVDQFVVAIDFIEQRDQFWVGLDDELADHLVHRCSQDDREHEHLFRTLAMDTNRAWPVDPYRALNFFPINHVGCLVDVSTPASCSAGRWSSWSISTPAKALN
ncbi:MULTISPECIES: hypothetical protein [unclassified Sphingomonas]|uniref:hypothetical protein n=1 Tax=unclassified Sphingomonas TaxID=196159 RepID=UPI0012E3C2BD|nr:MULTISPECIES: hypothetical protein [unclassified Sphingomonas]